MRPKLIIVGAAGRMGRRIVSLCIDAGWFDIIAAIEEKGHPDIGKDAGFVASAGPVNVKLDSTYPGGADIVIDYTREGLSSSSIYSVMCSCLHYSDRITLPGQFDSRGRPWIICSININNLITFTCQPIINILHYFRSECQINIWWGKE